jgi:hypothetical protein
MQQRPWISLALHLGYDCAMDLDIIARFHARPDREGEVGLRAVAPLVHPSYVS